MCSLSGYQLVAVFLFTFYYCEGADPVPSGSHLGCFKENSGKELETKGRLFPDYRHDSDTLTPQLCWELCFRNGFKLSGVQFRKECHCTNGKLDLTRKTEEGECKLGCSGDVTKKCGGEWRMNVYATGLTNNTDLFQNGQPPLQLPGTTPPPYCPFSLTIANGERVCKKSVIFSDNFQRLDLSQWRHEIKVSSDPDFEFTVYDAKPDNIFVKDGALHIQPTVYNDSFVESGEIALGRCTGDSFRGECSRKTDLFILPPVQSARIISTQMFKYGVIEVQAKFPLGDWIAADIRLEPAEYSYGEYYDSGRIRIISRGNLNLTDKDGREVGSQTVEGSVIMSQGADVKTKSIFFSEISGWRNTFHNFTIIWTPNDISFMIDGKRKQDIMQNARGSRLSDVVGFESSKVRGWSTGTSIAPFDQAFFVSLGVSVGGIRDFDVIPSRDSKAKPWVDSDPKAMLKFWNKRNEWKPTWKGNSSFIIKSIKVTAV